MITAVSAIVAMLLAGAWTGADRRAGRAIAGALACGAVIAGFTVVLGGDDVTAMVLRGAGAMAGAIIGIAIGLLLRNALAGGAERLRAEDAPRRTGVEKPSAEASETRRKLQAAVGKSRDAAERLVAGNVQLLDLSKLLEATGDRPRMGRLEALQIAQDTAKAFLKSADLMVPAGEEGLIFLFDGVGLAEAEAKSQEIADAITEALGAGDSDSPFVAKGFAYELDDYMQDAMIDSVDDLIRVVQLAHQAFVKREKNLAKDLDRELQLDPRPIVRPDTLSVIGYEIQVIRVRPGANRQRRDPLTFAALPAPYGAEIDCAAILKLASALRTLSLERDQAILLPVRFETLSHPLYLDNLMAALQMLQNDLRSRLICCLVIERASLPPRLDTVAKALQRFCKTVFIHPRQPFHGLDEAKSLGIGGLALSAADFASDADLQALEALVAKAREVDLFVMLLGASSELDTAQKLNLAYSRLKD